MIAVLFALACAPKATVPPAPPPAQGPPPPSEMVSLDGTEPVVGNPAAPVRIVQYSDFLCPHCAKGFEVLSAYTDTHPDTKIVFKTFPLSMECNPELGVSTIPDRCTLAYVAECGARAGRFRETASAIFADIATLGATGATPDALAKIAGRAALDPVALSACVADPTVRDAVMVDAHEGMRLHIRGTPSFWLTRADTPGFELYEGDPAQVITRLDEWRNL